MQGTKKHMLTNDDAHRSWKPQRVRRIMRKRGITLSDFARMLGYHEAAVRKYFNRPECPVRAPRLELRYEMAVALGVRPSLIDSRLTQKLARRQRASTNGDHKTS